MLAHHPFNHQNLMFSVVPTAEWPPEITLDEQQITAYKEAQEEAMQVPLPEDEDDNL
jgi:hypothetical protein